ncbi:MAG: sugar phosphate isomerase/epimerase, partial [Bacilli bacterium]|nr:sugar phosphate isomerase/epimerase [Bacilli bacterium]
NRKKPAAVDPGDTCAGVLQMIDEINSPFVGITWDMGHYYSNLVSAGYVPALQDEQLDPLPPLSFLDKTIHTHIHGLGEQGTHCPLTHHESLPLESYVRALKDSGYTGIYNLELQFNRFPDQNQLVEDALSSIERLRKCVL